MTGKGVGGGTWPRWESFRLRDTIILNAELSEHTGGSYRRSYLICMERTLPTQCAGPARGAATTHREHCPRCRSSEWPAKHLGRLSHRGMPFTVWPAYSNGSLQVSFWNQALPWNCMFGSHFHTDGADSFGPIHWGMNCVRRNNLRTKIGVMCEPCWAVGVLGSFTANPQYGSRVKRWIQI